MIPAATADLVATVAGVTVLGLLALVALGALVGALLGGGR